MEEIMTTNEVAKYLKVRHETILRKVKRGELKAYKVGGRRLRFYKSEVDAWLRNQVIIPKQGGAK